MQTDESQSKALSQRLQVGQYGEEVCDDGIRSGSGSRFVTHHSP